MKRTTVILFLMVLLCSVSLAQTKKATPKPVSEPATITTATQTTGMRFGLGSYQGLAGLRLAGDAFSGWVGLAFQSTSANNQTQNSYQISGTFTFNLTGGAIPTHVGAGLSYLSTPVNNQTSTTFTISGIYGAETTIMNNLNIGVDIFPLSFSSTSVGGASQTTLTLLTGTVYAAYLF